MSDSPISYLPTEGHCLDPNEPVYWDETALGKELERVFEVCHGCRMCFKYCDSFPSLFDFIDDQHDGDVRKITETETAAVMDACFQCKLCEVQCPYTPRDGHEFQLDFPKVVHRYKAIRARREGLSLRDRVLSNPDATGRVARMSLGMANVMNRVSVHRWFLEKFLGVHSEKQLPDFAGSTFEAQVKAQGKAHDRTGAEAVLFGTCYVQHNEPQIGLDTLEVLEKNQVTCSVPTGQVCCGMPAWERGDLDGVRAQAKRNLDVLMPHVEAGSVVIALNPTCAMMLRRELPTLVDVEDRARAEQLANAVRDPGEFLWSIRKEDRFCTEVESQPSGSIAYHAACHLRAQSVGFKSRDLLRKVLGVAPKTVMECCGHDGTYAMTVEGFEPSQRVGKKAFEGMQESSSSVWSTDCPLAAIQLEQHAGTRGVHPMTLLARAYRGDAWPEEDA